MPALDVTYKTLVNDSKEITDLGSIAGLLSWDQETMMPPKAIEAKARQLSLMSGIIHRRQTDEKRGEWIDKLAAGLDELAPEKQATVLECRRVFDKLRKLPPELVEEESRLCSLAHDEWIKARRESKFEIFAPWLEKIFVIKKRIADYWGYPDTPYDAMLDDYEPGSTTASVGGVLGDLRDKLVPWVHGIAASSVKPRTDFLSRGFPKDAQRELGLAVIRAIGFDLDAGRVDISAHPFCSGTGNDVRLTTRYFEDQPFASFYGMIHEAGHGLYEQGLHPEHLGAPLGSSSTMSIHESQSRLWENVIGRSKSFIAHFEKDLRSAYPEQLRDVSIDEIYAAVNRVQPSLIRVEADEVTYGLHIVVRFEIERELMSGALPVADLPAAWNARMEKYLGITPPNDAEGCLQDVHWSLGLVGYFPSYALGSLNAAQLFAAARRDLPGLDAKLAAGEYKVLLEWLREKVHRLGRRYTPDDLIEHVTGKRPSADDFMAYIADKFGGLYGVKV